MAKELKKAIMNRSRLKKKYQDWPSRENFKNWKKQKNKCNKLCRKAKKDYFRNITESNLNSNNTFWQFVKPFLTNKGVFGTDFISVKKDNKFIDNEIELVEMFNSHYINIAENMTGIPPGISPLYDLQENDSYCVKQIIKKFENHPRIVEIKKNINIVETFTIKEATVSDINTLLKSVNTKKATGPDIIPPKLVKVSANVIDSHLCNIINKGLQNSSFPDAAKIASVRPIYKKNCRNTIKDYRPVSVLNTFSKIYERHTTILSFLTVKNVYLNL